MRYMYTRKDGGITIVQGSAKEDLERVLGPLTEEAYMAHVIGKSVQAGVKEVIVLADDWKPPSSRHFRNAWKIVNGTIDIDMTLARDIQRNIIRAERKAQLEALDTDAIRAMSGKNEAAVNAIEAAKQKLRDAPDHPAIANAKTPEELAAITLARLIA